MNITKFLSVGVFASALVLAHLPFSDNALAAGRVESQEVRINLSDEPPSLDPTKYVDAVSSFWLGHMFEGLMTYDLSGKLVPAAAESFEVSADKKTYTFKLRKNAKWHDGKVVTAQDFEYTFQRLVDPTYASEYSFIADTAQLENAEEIIAKKKPVSQLGVKALDSHTLQVKLKNPVPYFLSIMAFQTFFPVRKDLVDHYKDKFATDTSSIVGNGPFQLAEWKKESSMRIVRAGSYWNASQIAIRAISTPVIIKDSSSAYNLFVTGGLDYISLDSELVKKAVRDKMKVKATLDGAVSFIQTNRRPGRLFSHIKLRQALKYGINRNEFVNKIVAIPGSKPAFGFIPETIPSSNPILMFRQTSPLKWKDNDVTKAKALINEYLKETKQQKVPGFTILSGDTTRAKNESEYLQNYLNRLFETEVKIDSSPFKTRLQKSRDGQYDLAFSGWAPDYPDPMTFLSLFSQSNENNRNGWSFEKFGSLLDKAQATADANQRNKLLFEAESILIDEAVIVPYLQTARPFVVAAGLVGVQKRSFGTSPDFKYAKWIQE